METEKFVYSKSDSFTQRLDRDDFESLLSGIAVIENLQKRKENKKRQVERQSKKKEIAVDMKNLQQDAIDDLSTISLNTIVFLASPLLIDTTQKIVSPSFVDKKEPLFLSVYYAGIAGIEKGVNKYDSTSDTGVSVHYIIRWFKTYAQREMERVEADTLGVSFSKLVRIKKIAAIRMRLEREYGKVPANEDVLFFITSGQAEPRNKGKALKDMQVSAENKKTTIEDIIEQEKVYQAYFLADSEQPQ